jgi:hypothetical protein
MEIVKQPTLEELKSLRQELNQRKAALLDKHGIFGGGEVVKAQHHVINKSIEKLSAQIKELEK